MSQAYPEQDNVIDFPGTQPEEAREPDRLEPTEANQPEAPPRGRHAAEPIERRSYKKSVILAVFGAVMLAIGGFLFGDATAENQALQQRLAEAQDEADALSAEFEAFREAEQADDEALRGEIDRLQGEVDRRIDPGVHRDTVEELDAANATVANQVEQIRQLNEANEELRASELSSRAEAARWQEAAELQQGIAQGLRGTLQAEREDAAARFDAALGNIAAHSERGDWINLSFRYVPSHTQLDFGFAEIPIGREEYDFHGLGTVAYGLGSEEVLRSREGGTEVVEFQLPVLKESDFKLENIDEESRLWFGASLVQVFTGEDTSRVPLEEYAEEQLELAACRNATLVRRQVDAVTEQVMDAGYGMDVEIVWRDRLGGSHTNPTDQTLIDNVC